MRKICPLLNHKKSPHAEVNKSLVGCIFGKWYFSPGEVRQWGCFASDFFWGGWLDIICKYIIYKVYYSVTLVLVYVCIGMFSLH